MKRRILSVMAIAAVAFVSCNKDEDASTELGEATIKGNVWADLDQTDSDVEGVEGMQVTVVVNTADWDQQPVPGYNYDEKVYTATTLANGDYELIIPATDDGYNITIEFEDVYTTRTTPTGTQDVKVTRANINKFIYSGAVITTKDEASVTVVNSNNQAHGTATIHGTVWVDTDDTWWDGTDPGYVKFTGSTNPTLNQQNVVWRYEAGNAPYNSNDNTVYTAAISTADGSYTLTVPTESLTGNYIFIDWGVLDFIGDGKINNAAGTADTTSSGVYTGSGIQDFNGFGYIDGDIDVNMDIFLNFQPL
ncbi:MAG: hypothetical protein HUJ25_10070 [Crocinitomicaceae bacterium]|nr:hypothetical protein [Crocinitomicaceae bacterium]